MQTSSVGTYGFPLRILNGREVRGMKKSRVRKPTNDTIDAKSIVRYLMIREEKLVLFFSIPSKILNFSKIRGFRLIT